MRVDNINRTESNMDYSDYHDLELLIRQSMNRLHDEYQEAMEERQASLTKLTNEYLGDFAIGKAVKYKGGKYFVQADFQSISDNRTAVTIRKAKKDGTPSINGAVHYFVKTSDLEVWNEL